ncbi:MAG: hypothetical protein IKH09_05230, partial [Clostridia bacterium]|nr:hypothetical protein [Clostridia bacterium]
MKKTEIRELYKDRGFEKYESVTVGGWVRSIRDSKTFENAQQRHATAAKTFRSRCESIPHPSRNRFLLEAKMKIAKKTLLLVLALVTILTAGCAPKYKTWTSGRKAGTDAVDVSKKIEDYTLMEGTAEEFSLPTFFTNDMIVPRDRRINIWGTAPESQNGKVVAAEFRGLKGSGVIENGAFRFYLQGTLPACKDKGNSLIVTGGAGVRYEF